MPKRGRARAVPQPVVDLLRQARDMVASGQATSYEAAFRALEGRAVPSPEVQERILKVLEGVMEKVSEIPVILGLLQHLKEELGRTQREVAQIRLILYAGGFEGRGRSLSPQAHGRADHRAGLEVRCGPRGLRGKGKRGEGGVLPRNSYPETEVGNRYPRGGKAGRGGEKGRWQ